MRELPEYVNELSGEIIGAAIEVHTVLGPGFLESVYEEAMCKELLLRSVPFERQKGCGIDYKGEHIGEGTIDLFVAKLIVVELKAVDALAPIHSAQVISYLKMTKAPLGLLFNFNVPKLMTSGFKRIILS